MNKCWLLVPIANFVFYFSFNINQYCINAEFDLIVFEVDLIHFISLSFLKFVDLMVAANFILTWLSSFISL